MRRVRRPKGLMPTENILEYGPLPLPGGYQVHHLHLQLHLHLRRLLHLLLHLRRHLHMYFHLQLHLHLHLYLHLHFLPEEGEKAQDVCCLWGEKVGWRIGLIFDGFLGRRVLLLFLLLIHQESQVG